MYASITKVTTVDYLGGGGLYRASAIQSVDYLAHRWLKACEEAELGARLRKSGWTLFRLPVVAISHTGHNESSVRLLWRTWHNRRIHAYGAWLRSAYGRPWWWKSARIAWFVFAPLGVYLGAMSAAWLGTFIGASAINVFLLSMAISWGSVFAVLALKKRSVLEAAIAVAAWHLHMIAAAISFVHKVPDPSLPIPGYELGMVRRSASLRNDLP